MFFPQRRLTALAHGIADIVRERFFDCGSRSLPLRFLCSGQSDCKCFTHGKNVTGRVAQIGWLAKRKVPKAGWVC